MGADIMPAPIFITTRSNVALSVSYRTYAFKTALAVLAALVLFWALVPVTALAADTPFDAQGSTITETSYAAQKDAQVTIADAEDEALLENSSFGIEQFARQNKGTNRAIDGTYYGYRWPMAAADAFSVVVNEYGTLVYVPQSTVDALGVDLADETFTQTFLTTFDAIDQASSHGGRLFKDVSPDHVYFTSSDTVTWLGYTYRFGEELESEHWYATCTLPGSEDGSNGGVYEATGVLADAASMNIVEAPTGLAWLAQFFAELDWSPLWVSLRTTIVATLIIFILGLFAAWGTIKTSDRIKGILDTIFTIPMVLPPTVCGFLLLLFFGKSPPIGRWLIAHGIDIVFTWPAAVIACVVVGFPLMYRTARGAFENLEPSMLDAARTLGWSEGHIFRKLMLPLAWPSIAAGTVLAFARAMGEFGATPSFAGNFPGITQTIPIAIYFDWMGGKTETAIFWVIVVILFSFIVILFINVYSSRVQNYRAAGRRRKRDAGEPETATESAAFTIDSEAARRLGLGSSDGRTADGNREENA